MKRFGGATSWRALVEQLRSYLGHGLRPLGVPDLEARVDGNEEGLPISVAPGCLQGRWHVVPVDPQRSFLWCRARDREIERGAQRVEIRPRALQPAVGGILLMRGIASFDDAGHPSAHICHRLPRSTEIQQHRTAIGAHDDVVGSDVAMEEILAVHQLECVEQRFDKGIEFALCRWPA